MNDPTQALDYAMSRDLKKLMDQIKELKEQRDEGRQLVHDWSAECERLQCQYEELEAEVNYKEEFDIQCFYFFITVVCN